MLLNFIGTLLVVATFAYHGYNMMMDPIQGARQLRATYLDDTLNVLGVQYRLQPNDYQLLAQVLGSVLFTCSLFAVLNILRRLSGFILALYVITMFLLKYIDVKKPFDPIKFVTGREEMLLRHALLLGALLLIASPAQAKKKVVPKVSESKNRD